MAALAAYRTTHTVSLSLTLFLSLPKLPWAKGMVSLMWIRAVAAHRDSWMVFTVFTSFAPCETKMLSFKCHCPSLGKRSTAGSIICETWLNQPLKTPVYEANTKVRLENQIFCSFSKSLMFSAMVSGTRHMRPVSSNIAELHFEAQSGICPFRASLSHLLLFFF